LSKLPDDVRRNLERVPDDPGALLRRKFELEYRERIGAQPVDGAVQ
jgi:Ca-activated chloride channel family protein